MDVRLLGLRVRILPEHGCLCPFECCVLSGIGLCNGLITRPTDFCVSECDLETSAMGWPRPTATVEP